MKMLINVKRMRTIAIALRPLPNVLAVCNVCNELRMSPSIDLSGSRRSLVFKLKSYIKVVFSAALEDFHTGKITKSFTVRQTAI